MKFTRLPIPDVILVEPHLHTDLRGHFFESYRRQEFAAHGIDVEFIQDNQSRSHAGVVRGLHFQIPPHAQAKLVRVIAGEIFDVAVDLRRDSATYGKHVGIVINADNRKALFIPAGFAHGYCATCDGTELIYKISSAYSPEHERGLRWDDPSLSIAWPKLDVEYLISDKDQKLPLLKDLRLET